MGPLSVRPVSLQLNPLANQPDNLLASEAPGPRGSPPVSHLFPLDSQQASHRVNQAASPLRSLQGSPLCSHRRPQANPQGSPRRGPLASPRCSHQHLPVSPPPSPRILPVSQPPCLPTPPTNPRPCPQRRDPQIDLPCSLRDNPPGNRRVSRPASQVRNLQGSPRLSPPGSPVANLPPGPHLPLAFPPVRHRPCRRSCLTTHRNSQIYGGRTPFTSP